ncbi:uncharacterized protein LOC143680256 [Tamandua tetradactyla]|uniref:uncharacterized protein LOC143680256 n=1 Tax=Tamandua tetradactyla TaxID=48850 RepID=UPI0040546D98
MGIRVIRSHKIVLWESRASKVAQPEREETHPEALVWQGAEAGGQGGREARGRHPEPWKVSRVGDGGGGERALHVRYVLRGPPPPPRQLGIWTCPPHPGAQFLAVRRGPWGGSRSPSMEPRSVVFHRSGRKESGEQLVTRREDLGSKAAALGTSVASLPLAECPLQWEAEKDLVSNF